MGCSNEELLPPPPQADDGEGECNDDNIKMVRQGHGNKEGQMTGTRMRTVTRATQGWR